MITWVIIIGGIILIILLIVGVVVSSNSERTLVEQRLSQYLDDGKSTSEDRDAQRSMITDWVSKIGLPETLRVLISNSK